jgi:hypothetical protein
MASMAITAAHLTARDSNPPYIPERRPRLWVGGMQFAFSLISGAFLDSMGRGDCFCDVASRRQRACEAIRWLRLGGRLDPTKRGIPLPPELKSEYIASMDWACSVLSVDARQIAWNGLHSIPGSGLRNWRCWRGERNANRIKKLALIRKTCLWCGIAFLSKRLDQTLCSASCAHAAQRARRKATVAAEITTPQQVVSLPTRAFRATTWGQGYQCYVQYCQHVGVAPAREDWWRCLAR